MAATIEDDLGNAGFNGFLANDFAQDASAFDVCAALTRCLEIRAKSRDCAERLAIDIVNDLNIDIGIAARNTQTRTSRRTKYLAANTGVTAT